MSKMKLYELKFTIPIDKHKVIFTKFTVRETKTEANKYAKLIGNLRKVNVDSVTEVPMFESGDSL